MADQGEDVIDIVFERVDTSKNLWSFLQGSWELTNSQGVTQLFRMERDKSGLAYVGTTMGTDEDFCGVFGMNNSNQEQPMLVMGLHERGSYSIGNWKRNDDGSVAGNFTMFSPDGEKEHSGLFEPIEEGYRYTIDDSEVNYFRRK